MADTLDTGRDLLAHFLRRCGEILPSATGGDVNEADRLVDAKIYINEAHWWICAARAWRWARKSPPKQFVSIAEDRIPVVSIVGDTVTLTSPLTASRAGRKFMIDSDGIPHRIKTHAPSSATLVLETVYTGEITSGEATIFQDELVVATDILAWPDITDVRTAGDLRLITEVELRRLAPANVHGVTRGVRYGAFITDSVLRIAPWTSEIRLFECSYNVRAEPMDFSGGVADTPIVPRNFRPIIAWRAEAKLMADKRPDDKRLLTAEKEVNDLLTMMQNTEAGFHKARAFVPRGFRVSGR